MSNIFRSIILTFLSCFSFISAKADFSNFLTNLYLSDKGYAKNMEVQTYIVTKDQILSLFTEGTIEQKLNNDFHEEDEIFLIVRIKNNGDRYAVGTLQCRVPNCDSDIIINLVSSHGGKLSKYQNWVIPLGNIAIDITKDVTQVSYKWKNLYTY